LIDNGHTKPVGEARRREIVRCSRSPFAIVEIISNDDVTRAKPGDQNTLNKFIGGKTSEFCVEGHNNGQLHAVMAQERQFLVDRSELKMRPIGLKNRARMRLKDHYAGAHLRCMG
jgi:hypothetical protein